ncbi:MAG TPA: RNA polymerase sigma factor [Woeseiaceae bacterium]|jgi:RNA polymerase sigma-70 factor (ECF subfamily)|nr:RNA polymerase sigma factor [Woeseiaceae bacterium]
MSKEGGHVLPGRRRELLELLPRLRRFALSLAGNPPDADDLLQSTVERVLERGLPAEAALLPWSIRVCRNIWIDEMRARKVRRAAGEDSVLADEQIVWGESDVMATLTLREVQGALARLADEQRAVLELVAVEGHSYREAADLLETPIGTVMSRLARARAALLEHCGKLTPVATARRGRVHD